VLNEETIAREINERSIKWFILLQDILGAKNWWIGQGARLLDIGRSFALF
jgi:hypothetical protein